MHVEYDNVCRLGAEPCGPAKLTSQTFKGDDEKANTSKVTKLTGTKNCEPEFGR